MEKWKIDDNHRSQPEEEDSLTDLLEAPETLRNVISHYINNQPER